jgi:DNA replication protein DnaD
MANEGWISIHRQLQDNSIWSSSKPFDDRSAWIDILLMANHKDREIQIGNQIVVIKKGQRFTSIRKLAEKWHWSTNRVKRYLDMLVSAGMIYKDSTHGGTLLTIVNYGKFQDSGYTNGHTNEDTNDTPVKTQAIHQRITNNNDNNELIMTNNENKIIPAPPYGGGEWQ